MKTGKVFFLFQKAIFSGLFNWGSREWKVAGKELISKKTFRLPDASHTDALIGFRVFKRTWQQLSTVAKEPEKTADILIFDSESQWITLRREYMVWARNYKDEELLSLTRDISYMYAPKCSSKFFLFLLSIFIIPVCVFSKNRVQWALILSEFAETLGCLNFAIKAKVQQIHYFSPAEKDSNLFYLILNRFNFIVIKHPSPGALVSHNKNLMTDILALSSNYQKEEYEIKLKDSVLAKQTEMWPPETAHHYAHLYAKDLIQEKPGYKFGFYSHGGWIRKKQGKTMGLFSKPEQEEMCLSILGDVLKKYTNEKLIIFLHPKEKANLEETKAYYFKWFSSERIGFYLEKRPSSFDFNKAAIGIGSYSTVLFERDYFGFKSLILREDDRGFPVEGTTFYKYSFASSKELIEKIELLN